MFFFLFRWKHATQGRDVVLGDTNFLWNNQAQALMLSNHTMRYLNGCKFNRFVILPGCYK